MTSPDAVLDDYNDFRVEVRNWFGDHVPVGWRDQMRNVSTDEFVAFQRDWFRTLGAAGYAVPHWPKEWGGGFTLPQQVILYQEAALADAPYNRVFSLAIQHAAATLLHAGSDEQRRFHLPRILAGDEIWCQGFSEPGAGSDLASLRTRAVRDGDQYRINGQKVWTSLANKADWCLLLARTDMEAKKHHGISYFLLKMDQPGVEVRTIRKATGGADFCELFLTDAVIPAQDRIGLENEGWRIAQSTLSAERGLVMVELAERLWYALERLSTTLCGNGGLAPESRNEFAEIYGDAIILRRLCRQLVHELVTKGGVGAEASVLKLFYSQLLQRLTAFGARAGGLAAQQWTPEPQGAGWHSLDWVRDYVGSWAWTIAGGTNEIQHSLVAERVLGLPRDLGRS